MNSDKSTPDSTLTSPLEVLRGGIRRFVLWDGLLIAGLFVVAWFWIGLALDYGLFKLTGFDWVPDAPWGFRAAGLLIASAGLAALLVWYLWRRLTKTFNYTALALVLEKRFPDKLGDRLITAVELSDTGAQRKYGYSEELIRQSINEAKERVATVPVNSVFNWPRLKKTSILLGLFAIGGLAIIFLGYSAISKSFSPGSFAWRFADVSSTWAERNILLQDTPWPRKAHLELLDFPGDEVRIGKETPQQKVRVRAFKWVIADRTHPAGWRPLLFSDLTPALGVSTADVSAQIPPTMDVDRLEMVYTPGFQPILEQLEALAAEPAPRKVRKLNVPDAVNVRYAGMSTRGDQSLTREGDNIFTGEISALQESVRFYAKGDDYTTPSKLITLVPPPSFIKLTRKERRPAYLYRPAPSDGAETLDKRFQLLKGLKQEVAEKDVTLTGDKSLIPAVVQGTELTLSGLADKDLKEFRIVPKAGRIPGLPVGAKDPLVVKANGANFNLAFTGEYALKQTTEFELILVDNDNVESKRTIIIQVVEDQAPIVELAVDVLRKQGNAFLVTPIARVPFVADSFVKDDRGLSKVEYVFNYSSVESKEVISLQAVLLMTAFAGAPLPVGMQAVLAPAATGALAQTVTKTDRKTAGTAMVFRFADKYASLPVSTQELLAKQLANPVDGDPTDVVKDLGFRDPKLDFFDLEKAAPSLKVTDAAGVQPQYKLELLVVATDTNVETGPKTGQNLEPIRLLVISEAELLAEMSKDEENLIARIDDTLKKLRGAQAKLADVADRLVSPNPPQDLLLSMAVRSQDIGQDIGKGLDLTNGTLIEYRRLYREGEVNRIGEQTMKRYEKEVISPLDELIQKEFPAAVDAHNALATQLAENRKPVATVVDADRTALLTLIVKLQRIRDQMGEALSLQKARDELLKILTNQQRIGRFIASIYNQKVVDLFLPEIAPSTITLAKGAKGKVKHTVNWKVYDKDSLTVALSTTASSKLTIPATLTVSADKDDFEYEIQAGDVAGDFTITLTPAVGKASTVKVTVK